MTQHTPGPWTANYYIGHWQIDADTDAICTTVFCYAPEKESNARLIAAAPDLLDALNEMLFHHPGDSPARRQARAAVAKATGGES